MGSCRGWMFLRSHSGEIAGCDALLSAPRPPRSPGPRRPVMVSHTGVQGVCPGERNLDDATAREAPAVTLPFSIE